MDTRKTAALPSGGPLKIDVGVAELLLSQLAIMCAPRNDQREKDAISQRKIILQSLDAAQRGHARTCAASFCGYWTSAIPASALPRSQAARVRARLRDPRGPTEMTASRLAVDEVSAQ
jgi:hypothetical protein